jgi:hypothetical protein
MKSVNSCVICGEDIVCRKRGVVAPFLAKRIWDRVSSRVPVQLVECTACGFLFFNPRLEADEEQILYSGYRLDAYQRMRQSYEPWYTRKFNAALSNPRYIAARKEKLSSILSLHLAGTRKPNILDFGGDRGQLIQGLVPDSAAWVYDISKVAPLEGIGICRNLIECQDRKFDLIICSNVLEHVGFPQGMMEQIAAAAAPHTFVFIEVPFESPFGGTLIARRLVQLSILAFTTPLTALMLLRSGFMYLMHEHINYFNPESLRKLMTVSSFNIVASDAYGLNGPMGKGKMGWCLGRLAAPPR